MLKKIKACINQLACAWEKKMCIHTSTNQKKGCNTLGSSGRQSQSASWFGIYHCSSQYYRNTLEGGQTAKSLFPSSTTHTSVLSPPLPLPLYQCSFSLSISPLPALRCPLPPSCYLSFSLHPSSACLFCVRHSLSFSGVDRPPAVTVDAVDAAHAVRSWGHVVQVGPGAVDLGAGEGAVVQVLAAHPCRGVGQVHVRLVRLVDLRLVGEEDLGFGAEGRQEGDLFCNLFKKAQK